jgi:hypothetical protein
MYCDTLKKQVHYYKETEGGREIVCQIIEEFAEERAEERAELKRIDTLLDSVKNLMETMKLTSEQAMDALKISLEDRSVILKRLQ